LGLGFLRPHVPLYIPQKWFDIHPLEGIEVPPYLSDDLNDIPSVGLQINDLPMMPSTEWAIESGEWKKIIQAYLACVSFVDYELGRVMKALEKSEHANNTVIVLWSDHGYRLGEKGTFAKHALWETATHVPLMFAGPNVPKGKIIDAPVELLSLYPTLLELSGLPTYNRNEGKSLVPLMNDKKQKEGTFALTTFGMNNHAVKFNGYRYIRYEDGTEEFYDHKKDPNEWTNEAKNPNYNNEITALKKYLPSTNVRWDVNSNYPFQPYFVKQKKRINGAEK
jgi:arylsulfatase A-like enzyme